MKQYGLLGYPLGHSFSRAFFTDKFQREGIDAEYLNFELPDISQLPEVLDAHPQLRGLNVTIPHKQAVIPYLDALSDEARAIGAVNTIRITHDADGHRLLKGFNSDIIGFTDSIRPLLKPHHTRALVLGTGGASKAICRGLEQLGLEWCYVSRSPREGLLTYSDITPARIADYTVIVNRFPAGNIFLDRPVRAAAFQQIFTAAFADQLVSTGGPGAVGEIFDRQCECIGSVMLILDIEADRVHVDRLHMRIIILLFVTGENFCLGGNAADAHQQSGTDGANDRNP